MSDFNPATLLFIRKSLKMTQEALSQKCGISRDMVSDWERGKHKPSKRNIKKLENIFELSEGDLCKSPDELFVPLSAHYIPLLLETRMRSYEWADREKDLRHQSLANQTAELLLRELKALRGYADPAEPTEAQIKHESLLDEGDEPEWKKKQG